MAAAAVIAATNAAKKRERKAQNASADQQSDTNSQASTAEPKGPRSWVGAFLDLVNDRFVQIAIYFAFVYVFQMLTATMRIRTEFYIDKHVMDRIVENHFDSSHNTFESIRRVADIWEWGNTVLWPGLMGDLGPCDGDGVGSTIAGYSKTCIDEAWPDGDGSFHGGDRVVPGDGPTPYGLTELVERMDQFDWTDGVLIRQGRASPQACKQTDQLGTCYPELMPGQGSQQSFGYNWTHPGADLTHPYTYFSSDDLGANPQGFQSASTDTGYFGQYDADGFVALVIPFFSDSWLEPQEGTHAQVRDYRQSYVTPRNGRTPRYYCVRTSSNGLQLKQSCDPGTGGNGTGAMTGHVRRQVEVLWNDLKRGHFIDMKTRVFTITLQLRNNYEGVRYRMTMIAELTALGAVFTSYDVETRPLVNDLIDDMALYANLGLGLVIFFCLLEAVELANGVVAYFQDMWNVMDWGNFIIYFMVYIQIQVAYSNLDETPLYGDTACTSRFCVETGYFDDWKLMGTLRDCKILLSLCLCIQLLKLLKFLSIMIPKLGLATGVLRRCLIDLLFFGIAFVISMLSFSMMLYVQLGPFMASYLDNATAFLSLGRALFGDFDIDEILDNSPNFLNTILFVCYLFVAIFIMLSMFLAILADAQVERKEERKARELQQVLEEDGWASEYGVLTALGNRLSEVKNRLLPATVPATALADAAETSTTDEDAIAIDEGAEPTTAAPTAARASGADGGAAADALAAMLSQQKELMEEVRSLRTELSTLRDKTVMVNFAPPPLVNHAAAEGSSPTAPMIGSPYRPQGAPMGVGARTVQHAPPAPPAPPPPPGPPPPRALLAANGHQPPRYNV